MLYNFLLSFLCLVASVIILLGYVVAVGSVATWLSDEAFYGETKGVFLAILWMVCAFTAPVALIVTLAGETVP